MRAFAQASLCCMALACAASQAPRPAAQPILERVSSGSTALLQAVSASSEGIVWVSGHAAAGLGSTDGGATWTTNGGPGAAAGPLQVLDVPPRRPAPRDLPARGPRPRSATSQQTHRGGTSE